MPTRCWRRKRRIEPNTENGEESALYLRRLRVFPLVK